MLWVNDEGRYFTIDTLFSQIKPDKAASKEEEVKCTQSHIRSNMLTTKLKALYEFEGALTLYCLRLGHIDVIMFAVARLLGAYVGPNAPPWSLFRAKTQQRIHN